MDKNFYERLGLEFNENEIGVKLKEMPNISEEVKPGRWAVLGDTYYGCDSTADKVATGVYTTGVAMGIGAYLRKENLQTDDLIKLPDDASDEILNHIEEFWSLKERFRKAGYLHKRGILLWGPPGNGKTSVIQQTLKSITDKGGIGIIGDYPGYDVAGIRLLRSLEPDRPIVVVYEDVDAVIWNYGDRILTSLLDGEANVDNVLFLATTNNPERLPPRLLNRPSRFDVVKLLGFPGKEARKTYLNAKTSLSPSEITIWVNKTSGLSIAHLKELIILVTIYGKELDEAIDRLNNMSNLPDSRKVNSNKNIEVNINTKEPIINVPEPIIHIHNNEKATIREVERDENGLIIKIIDHKDI